MPTANLEITADNSAFVKALQDSQEKLKESFEQMRGTVEGLSGAFEKVQKAVLGITSLLAGGAAFKEVLESTVKWAEGSIDLSRALGITTERASVYQAALEHLGISNETLVTASDKVSKQIHANAAAFEKLGVNVKDANGAFRPSVDIIAQVNGKLSAMPNVIERNIMGQQLYGRGWADIRPLLRLTSEEMGQAEERAKSLGLIVGPQGAAQAHAYKEGLADVHLVVTALSQQLGNDLIPVLINTGRIFAESGPKDLAVFSTILKGLAYAGGTVAIEFEKMGMWIGKLAAQAAALVHGDFGAIGAIQKDFNSDLEALNKNADELWDKLNRPVPVQKSPEPEAGPPTQDEGGQKSRTGDWQTALQEKKSAYEEAAAAQGQLLEFSKQQEIGYWQQILATTKTTLEEKKQIRAKIAADELAIDKAQLEGSLSALKNDESAHGGNLNARLAADMKYADTVKGIYGVNSKEYADAEKAITATHAAQLKQRLELDQIQIQNARTLAGQQIDVAEAAAKEKYSLEQISLSQLIAVEKNAEAERYALHQQALQQDLALLAQNPNYDPVKYAQVQQQILQAATQHNQQMLKIDQQANSQEIALQKTLQQTMTQGFATAFESIVKGTMTVHQAFTKMLDSVLSSVLQMLAKMLAQYVVSTATQLLLGKQQQASNAATAATGAGASVAAIPFVGWAMAPIEMAAVFAAASGYSASQGFDIPSNLAPQTQLHPKEMVLPADLADRVRAVTPNADGSGGGRGGMTLNIKANDAKSFQKQLKSNGSLNKALRDMHRRMQR